MVFNFNDMICKILRYVCNLMRNEKKCFNYGVCCVML